MSVWETLSRVTLFTQKTGQGLENGTQTNACSGAVCRKCPFIVIAPGYTLVLNDCAY